MKRLFDYPAKVRELLFNYDTMHLRTALEYAEARRILTEQFGPELFDRGACNIGITKFFYVTKIH